MRRDSHTAGTSTHRPSRRLCKEFLGAALGRLDQPVERLEIGGTGILIDGVPAGLALAQLASGDPSENGGPPMGRSVTPHPAPAPPPHSPPRFHGPGAPANRGSRTPPARGSADRRPGL